MTTCGYQAVSTLAACSGVSRPVRISASLALTTRRRAPCVHSRKGSAPIRLSGRTSRRPRRPTSAPCGRCPGVDGGLPGALVDQRVAGQVQVRALREQIGAALDVLGEQRGVGAGIGQHRPVAFVGDHHHTGAGGTFLVHDEAGVDAVPHHLHVPVPARDVGAAASDERGIDPSRASQAATLAPEPPHGTSRRRAYRSPLAKGYAARATVSVIRSPTTTTRVVSHHLDQHGPRERQHWAWGRP